MEPEKRGKKTQMAVAAVMGTWFWLGQTGEFS